MYILLPFYAVSNIVDQRWGTRESVSDILYLYFRYRCWAVSHNTIHLLSVFKILIERAFIMFLLTRWTLHHKEVFLNILWHRYFTTEICNINEICFLITVLRMKYHNLCTAFVMRYERKVFGFKASLWKTKRWRKIISHKYTVFSDIIHN